MKQILKVVRLMDGTEWLVLSFSRINQSGRAVGVVDGKVTFRLYHPEEVVNSYAIPLSRREALEYSVSLPEQ